MIKHDFYLSKVENGIRIRVKLVTNIIIHHAKFMYRGRFHHDIPILIID